MDENEETEDEIKKQFTRMSDFLSAPKIDDAEQQSWEEACEYFEKSEGHKPNLFDYKENLMMSAIQLGILETYKKYKLL